MATLKETLDRLMGPSRSGSPGPSRDTNRGTTTAGAGGGPESGNIQAQVGAQNIKSIADARAARARRTDEF